MGKSDKPDSWLELPVGVVDDGEIPKDGIELPPGSLDAGPLAGLGFGWVQPKGEGDSGRVLALTVRTAALPSGATVPSTLASAMGLNGVVQLRKPTGRELRRSRKADAVAVYTAIVPAVAAFVGAGISTTMTGWKLWAMLALWVATMFAALYLAASKWRALHANSR